MTDVADAVVPLVGGPTLPQERRLVTAIPGPKARALHERRVAAVASGVGSALPIEVVAAGGGVIVDSDGNSLIDLGSGIAVVNVGNAAPAVAQAVAAQAAVVHPHLLHDHALRGLRGGVRAAQPAHARRPRQEVGAVQLGRRGRRERGEDRPPRHRPHRHRRDGARLPRAHQPHDGPHRQVDAVQGGVRARSPPTSTGCRWRTRTAGPAAPTACGARGRGRGHRPHPHRDRRRHRGRHPHRADPGRGRLHRPRQGLPAGARRSSAARTGSSSSPTRSRPASAAPAQWFACEHEGIVPDLITTAKGIAGGLPLAAVTGRAERHGLRARRRARRHLRRQPGRLRRRARHHRPARARRPHRPRPSSSAPPCAPASTP